MASQANRIQPCEYLFVDLFAGIGGMRLGFESHGNCRCVFSSEIDRFARETYRSNFGEEPSGDIVRIPSEDIPAHDILVAGFPCQPFSIAGVSKYESLGRGHGFRDRTKGTLFREIVRILESHRPTAFLLENVKNLRSHDRGRTWQVIRGALEDTGYRVEAKIIDARRVVPQHRERIFIVGFRDRTLPFNWPEIPDRRPRLRQVLDAGVDPRYTLSSKLWDYLRDYARKHRERGNGFGYGLADPDGVTRTLSARYFKDGSEILIAQDGGNPRRLTPRECARLMGFPDTFRIPVSDTQAYKQFGNAVVVPVVGILAGAIIDALENRSLGQLAMAAVR
jgi:DNA (cytosine-5)-methyltransferase 1